MRKIDGLDSALAAQAQNGLRAEADARERQAVLVQKLDYLSAKFDSVCEEDVEAVEEIMALPSERRSRILAYHPDRQNM